MILLGKESHELNGTAAKYLDQNSTAGYFDGLSNPAHRLSNPAHGPSNPAAQAQQSCSTGPENPAFDKDP